MTCFVLDVRTATDHFPGIGRYVANPPAISQHTGYACAAKHLSGIGPLPAFGRRYIMLYRSENVPR